MNQNPFTKLTSFQRDIIIVLGNTNERIYGAKIKKKLASMYDTDKIHRGRLYPSLDTVIDYGFVERYNENPRVESYKISQKGINALKQYNSLTDCE